MFVGHIGAGLALKRAHPEVSLGVLFLAVMLLDLILWLLVLAGIEQVIVPTDFAAKHYVLFVFPYSHSLVGTVVWSTGAAVVARRVLRLSPRAALVVAIAVLSHFALDAVVHVRGLPVLPDDSYKLGLGLWQKMPLELVLELSITFAGLVLYASVGGVSRRRLWGCSALVALVSAMTVVGQTVVAAPPSPVPAIVIIAALGAVGFWLDPSRVNPATGAARGLTAKS